MTEYALLLVLIALAAVASMKDLASTIKNVFSNAAATLSSTLSYGRAPRHGVERIAPHMYRAQATP